MRFVIYGAGAIGGTLGISLATAGHDVQLLARGSQLAAIRQRGLTLETPDGETTLPLPVAEHPAELDFDPADVVLLAMKSQDTELALRELSAAAPEQVRVVCMQNGVENERLALRHFPNVIGAMVIAPATFLSPGLVSVTSAPTLGLCEVGLFPDGEDDFATQLAAYLEDAHWASRALPDIMRWKYAKLLDNLSNAAQVVVGLAARGGEVAKLARAEGVETLEAAGIAYLPRDEMEARRAETSNSRPIAGRERQGASTWQSVERGTGSVESDYLNGEIVRIARLNGRTAPVNELLQRLSNEIAWSGGVRGPMTEPEFLALLG